MNYVAVELHSHTNHSDGRFTVEELINHAVQYGYDAIALTDHNTVSGHEEIEDKGLHEKITVIKGIEWTTFYGHMLVLNTERLVDWRTANTDNIDDHIAEIRRENGIVGVAHPKVIGNPICTGCRWEFNVVDWDQVNFIEIWNHVKPDESFASEEAYDFWRGLLKRGYHLAPSSGRDWHYLEKPDENTAVTYVGVGEDDSTKVDSTAIVEAIKKGNMYVTLGPRIDVSLTVDGKTFYLGETAKQGSGVLHIEALPTAISKLEGFDFPPKYYRVLQSEEVIYEEEITEGPVQIPVELESGYIRIELIGDAKGKEMQRLTVTSPIYVN